MFNCECRHNRTSHIFETETLCGRIVAGFCVLGRMQQQPLFSLISARATSGSLCRPILDSLRSQSSVWLVREGLFALVPQKEHGCRVHPSHLAMPSSGSTKICTFQNYCSVFKAGFSLEGLHFQKQLRTLNVHIFQYWLEFGFDFLS